MIPKIIHQLWDECENPLPDFFRHLSKTWKEHHPDWQYEFWDGDRMKVFVKNNYSHLVDIYSNYKYNVQRWDLIRYLILYKFGGMYIDFDFECLESFDNYISEEEKCYFAIEPEEHCFWAGKDFYFSNALMIAPPGHPFLEMVITHLHTTSITYTGNKLRDVVASTGPLMLTNLYEKTENKTFIDFFLPEQVMPWTQNEVLDYIAGKANEEILEKKLGKAIAIHYFWGSWLKNDK
jgi:mannosyltransferase OCH1-like enzyme